MWSKPVIWLIQLVADKRGSRECIAERSMELKSQALVRRFYERWGDSDWYGEGHFVGWVQNRVRESIVFSSYYAW